MPPGATLAAAALALLGPAMVAAAPAPPAHAPVVQLGPAPVAELGPDLGVLVDGAGSLGPAEALQAAAEGRFRRGAAAAPGPGARVAWFHAVVRGGPPGTWALTWDQPLVDRLDVWLLGGGREAHLAGGLQVPPAERTVHLEGAWSRGEVTVAAGEEADLLVRVASSRPIAPAARLWTEDALDAHAAGVGLLNGLELGALLLVLLLSVVNGLVRRDRWSLRLAAVLASYLAYDLAATGQAVRWLWPASPRWAVGAPPALAALTGLLGLAFARGYVASAERHPRLDRLARAAAWLAGACAVAAAAAPFAGAAPAAILLGAGASAMAFVVMVALGAAAVRRGDRPARWFLACGLLVSFFGLAYVAAVVGLVTPGTGVLGGLRPALLGAALLLFVGVILRVEAERRGATAGLEEAVAERTASLRSTVDRLQVEVLEREEAERRLREADERFRIAFATSPDAINMTRLEDGVYVAVNEGFTQMSGWTEAEVLGRSALELNIWVDPADRARLVAGLKAHGQVRNLEARFRFKDGRQMVGLMSARLIHLGGAPHLLSITRDISDMRRAEQERDALAEQLRQAQKLEAIGRLAGGVAHDFNNLLTAITTNASLALLDLPPGDPGRAPFEEIEDAAARATSLTRQLLAFSRRQVIAPRPLDLAAHVAGMATMLRRVLGEDVAIAVATDEAPVVMADPGQVEQVLLNLAVNARDAVAPGGRIRVATRWFDVEAGRAAGRVPGRYGAIEVEDDGAGIDPEVLPHIFEPFFTTKHGKGTGLGLSTVYGIASQHGGFVDVDSAPGEGTRFRVCFPLAAAPARPAGPAAAGPEPLPGGRETVLLVEDEPSVREVTRTLLGRLGYQVLVAGSGEEALALAAAHAGPIELLLSDVVMPGMNGRQVAERLLAARPSLAVVLMSGYAEDVVGQAGVLDEGVRLVQKPFQPAQLAAALRQALAEAARPATA